MITPKEIEQYCENHSTGQHEIFRELEIATAEFAPKVSHMQVGNLEGKFLSFFAAASGVKRILEFGTFTGCSSLHFALAIPEDGIITTLDRDPSAVGIAKTFWDKAGMTQKIESLVGDAVGSSLKIEGEIRSGIRAPYDLAFIDADKVGYPIYFERALSCVKKGGWILVDNVLWSGRVLNPKEANDHAIHQFNESRKADPRVETLLLPLRDGLTLCRIR
ncbi:MAG: O-methyltransferase [Bdellovibrionales bacterium]|nr:O-methyltransferase [Bdellovibrionales bacterium]